MVVILCDGASKGNPGPSKIGGVIWLRGESANSKRSTSPVYTFSRNIGVATNNDAEWQSILHALGWVLVSGLTNELVYVYSDSQLVVNQINGVNKIKNDRMKEYKRKFDKICDELMNPVITVVWLPRQLTCLADEQANK